MDLIEEARQLYYDYDPREGGEWWIKTPPPREPWFEAELKRIGGHHTNGRPNLRVVWGGTEMSDMSYRPQLKYMRTRRIITGYYYERIDGSRGFIRPGRRPSDEELALIKDDSLFIPAEEDHHFGRLRWHIERYAPPEKLRQQKRFSHLYAEDGTRDKRDFPNEGVYDCFFVVQRRNYRYRDLDRQVLTAVEAMYHYNTTVIEAQKLLDAIDLENEQTIVMARAARAQFN